jgi:hypothetical protein
MRVWEAAPYWCASKTRGTGPSKDLILSEPQVVLPGARS